MPGMVLQASDIMASRCKVSRNAKDGSVRPGQPDECQSGSKEEMKFSWRDFVREARIVRGMELLAQGEITVGSVAQKVGFNSLSAFTLAFSNRVGLSPSEFMRQNYRVQCG
jgi:AraC-like DNA-binding protein